MKITAEELRKVYEETFEGAIVAQESQAAAFDAALLAVARYVAERQRGMEPTETMWLHGCTAVQEIYRKEGGWCGLKAAQDQVASTYRAMQSVAPLVVE